MNNLKQILKQKGISQIWLSEQLGVKAVTVNYWCQNTHQPSLDTLGKIAEILSINIKELV
jgi:putative transcriptional regulator